MHVRSSVGSTVRMFASAAVVQVLPNWKLANAAKSELLLPNPVAALSPLAGRPGAPSWTISFGIVLKDAEGEHLRCPGFVGNPSDLDEVVDSSRWVVNVSGGVTAGAPHGCMNATDGIVWYTMFLHTANLVKPPPRSCSISVTESQSSRHICRSPQVVTLETRSTNTQEIISEVDISARDNLPCSDVAECSVLACGTEAQPNLTNSPAVLATKALKVGDVGQATASMSPLVQSSTRKSVNNKEELSSTDRASCFDQSASTHRVSGPHPIAAVPLIAPPDAARVEKAEPSYTGRRVWHTPQSTAVTTHMSSLVGDAASLRDAAVPPVISALVSKVEVARPPVQGTLSSPQKQDQAVNVVSAVAAPVGIAVPRRQSKSTQPEVSATTTTLVGCISQIRQPPTVYSAALRPCSAPRTSPQQRVAQQSLPARPESVQSNNVSSELPKAKATTTPYIDAYDLMQTVAKRSPLRLKVQDAEESLPKSVAPSTSEQAKTAPPRASAPASTRSAAEDDDSLESRAKHSRQVPAWATKASGLKVEAPAVSDSQAASSSSSASRPSNATPVDNAKVPVAMPIPSFDQAMILFDKPIVSSRTSSYSQNVALPRPASGKGGVAFPATCTENSAPPRPASGKSGASGRRVPPRAGSRAGGTPRELEQPPLAPSMADDRHRFGLPVATPREVKDGHAAVSQVRKALTSLARPTSGTRCRGYLPQ